MKTIKITLLTVLTLVSCQTKKENVQESETVEIINEKQTTALVSVNPCDLITKEEIVTIFSIPEISSLEQFEKTNGEDSKSCQFIWNDTVEIRKANQVTITIFLNNELATRPSKFTDMLQVDLQKGVMGFGGQVIQPMNIEGLGNNAYEVNQKSNQLLHRIKFQKDNKYLVEITFNSNLNNFPDDINKKMKEIAKNIYLKI